MCGMAEVSMKISSIIALTGVVLGLGALLETAGCAASDNAPPASKTVTVTKTFTGQPPFPIIPPPATTPTPITGPVMVSPDVGVSPWCFKAPTFTPRFPGTTLSRSFDLGHWHYEIRYKYDPRKKRWQVAKSNAKRIRPPTMTPVLRSMFQVKVASIQAKSCPVNSLPLEQSD
jgi:hypothetical protein